MSNEGQILGILIDIQKQVSSVSTELNDIKRRLEDGDKAISCSKTGLIRIEESIKNLPCKQEKACSPASGDAVLSVVAEGATFIKNSKTIHKILWAAVGAGSSLILWLLDLAIKHIK